MKMFYILFIYLLFTETYDYYKQIIFNDTAYKQKEVPFKPGSHCHD